MRATAVLTALFLLGAAPAAGQSAREAGGRGEFDFYGLRFGMTRDQVRAAVRTNEAATEAPEPGHGMISLALAYDFRDRLAEIRASYERPADPLRRMALQAALRERFTEPVASRWRTVSADLDEAYNRAAVTLVLVSLDLRAEALEHFKGEFLRAMD